MPTLIYKNDSFECTTAIKGEDYIHLLDADGIMTSAFDGITDFSDFTLENGSYTYPTADHDCYLAVIRDDGTIGKGSHTCADVGNASPKGHTHTLAEIGAAAVDHEHTAEEVGAAPKDHTHTAEEVGAAAKNHNHDGVYAPMTVFGTEELTDGATSTYPEGTLYFVIEGV